VAAGLPGTGIGGLFFILSAFFMVIVELQRTIRGRSSLARWRIVARHAGIAAAMVAAITAVVWLLHQALFPSAAKAHGGETSTATDQLVPFAPVLITLAVLATVLATAYVAQFLVGREPSPLHPAPDRQPDPPTQNTTPAQPTPPRP